MNKHNVDSFEKRKAEESEKATTGLKTSSISRIGRPSSLYSAARTNLPVLENKNDSTMHRPADDVLKPTLPDQGSVLTFDTDSFTISQRVWVGGLKPGKIAYIGETHFAPGEWAGIVLDEPNGKNDGCVAGKRYFQCEQKKGIFSRLTRLTREPIYAALSSKESMIYATRSTASPERSRAISPTSSIRSSTIKSPEKYGLTVGDRVIVSSGFGSRPGILKYIGETKFSPGNWCGVQLDESTGKNDGSVDGFRYFDCPSNHGIFVPIAKVSLSPITKNSRLSRAGSRESLTSVGTLNSIATTNTSRLRMHSKKLGTAASKPVSAPRANYSLQDVIREKQNNIEQLMIERELDREDSQNQALSFQKTISELSNRINELESQLRDEKKKADDLRCCIEDATFCGDELSAQTQDYKEKIVELEKSIKSLTTNKPTYIYNKQVEMNDNATNLKNVTEFNKSLQEKNASLLNHVQELKTELVSKGEKQEQLVCNVKELQRQNEELINQVTNKETNQVCELKLNNELKNNLIDKLKEKVEEQALSSNILQMEIEKLSTENSLLNSQIIELHNKVSEKENLLNNKTHEIDSIHVELMNIKNVHDHLVQNDNEIKLHSEEQNREGLAKITELEKILSFKESEHIEIIKDFHTKITNLQTENESLKISLSESLILAKDNESQLSEALTKVKKLKIELEESKTECSAISINLLSQIKELETEIATLIQSIHENNLSLKAYEDKQIELNQATVKLRDFEQKYAANKSCIDIYESQIKAAKAENKNLRSMIDTKKTDYDILNKELQLVKEDNENKYKTLQMENKNLAMILQKKESDLRELKKDVTTKIDIIKEQSNKITELDSSIVTKCEECVNLQSNFEELCLKYKQEESVYKSEKEKLDKLQLEYNEVITTNENMKTEFDRLLHKLKEQEKSYSELRHNIHSNNMQKPIFEIPFWGTQDMEVEVEFQKRLEKSIQHLNVQINFLQEKLNNAEVSFKKQTLQVLTQNNLVENNESYNSKLKKNERSELTSTSKIQHTRIFNKLEEEERLKTKFPFVESSYRDCIEVLKKTQLLLLQCSIHNSSNLEGIIDTNNKNQLDDFMERVRPTEEDKVDFTIKAQHFEQYICNLKYQKLNLLEKMCTLLTNNEVLELIKKNRLLGNNINTLSCDNIIEIDKKTDPENICWKLNEEELDQKIIDKYADLKNKLSGNEVQFNEDFKANDKIILGNLIKEHSKCNDIINKLEENIKSLNEKLCLFESYDKYTIDSPASFFSHPENEDNNTVLHINFLNSIIADMQRKNDSLKAKINSLESFSNEIAQSGIFNIVTKRIPTARMFCDICDEFDLHETDDCPLQCSPSPPLSLINKSKEQSSPRKYCETCEVFDHEVGECPDDETY